MYPLLIDKRVIAMQFPQSTAVAGNGGLSHGSLNHLDLSTVEFGSTGEFEREKLTMAAAQVLLDYATAPPPTPKRKRELWHAPGGRGHEEDENAPPGKRARVLSSKAQEALVIKSPSPETSGVPKRRITRANTRRRRATSAVVRGESPAATAGLYMMSGGLQESPPATPGPSKTTLPTIAEETSPRPLPAASEKRTSSEKSGSNRVALSKGATNNTTTTESSSVTEPKGKTHSKRAANRTVATGRVTKAKATDKATEDPSRASSAILTAEKKAADSATRASSHAPSVDPAIKSEFSDAATRTSARVSRRTEKATAATKMSSKASTKAAESANTSAPPEPAVTALTAGSSNSATSHDLTSSAPASSNVLSTATSNSPALATAASDNVAATTITSSASTVAVDSTMVRGARGRLVDNNKSARMKKAWATRRKNGTSGRNGGPPKTETVRKNQQRGVDYGHTGDLRQD